MRHRPPKWTIAIYLAENAEQPGVKTCLNSIYIFFKNLIRESNPRKYENSDMAERRMKMAYDKGRGRKDYGRGGGYKGPKPIIIAAEETEKKNEVRIRVKLVNSFAGEKFIRFEFENTLIPDNVKETKGKEVEFTLKVPEGITSGRAKASLIENPSSKDEITIDFSRLAKKSKTEEKKEERKLKVSIQRGPMLVITAKTPDPKKRFTIASGGPLQIQYIAHGKAKQGVSGDNFFEFETGEHGMIQIVVKFKGDMVPSTFTFENETQKIPLIK